MRERLAAFLAASGALATVAIVWRIGALALYADWLANAFHAVTP